MMGRSMATPSFFEGPEKKLEVVVTPGFPPLRSLGDEAWRRVVEAAGAKVLSVLRSGQSDAYLLSESSLFVFDDWFVLITCGQTALVDAVPEILKLITKESIAFLVYERKSEHFPEHQPTTFYDDARRLQTMLPGRALRFGSEHGRYIEMFHTTRPYTPEKNDPTLEVLLHAIDEDVAEQFATTCASEDTSLGVSSGIEAILPGFATSLFDRLEVSVEGTGVGLALSQRIIETHDGDIWIESDGVGRGTLFCFTLPTAPENSNEK